MKFIIKGKVVPGGVFMLLPELAEKIVKEVRKLIGEDIIVVNTEGCIIASTDLDRVGTFHEGALIALKKRKKLIISEEDQLRLAGVKAGINLPIFFQNDCIGVIGITGDPIEVTPFGEIIRKMTELLVRENYYAEQFDWHSRAVESFVMDWIQLKEWDDSFTNRARLLSIDMKIPRTVAIIEFSGLTSPISRENWTAIFKYFQQNERIVAARSGNERVLVLFNSDIQPLRELIERQLNEFIHYLQVAFTIQAYAGVGQAYSPKEIQKSYHQAERSLNIARLKDPFVFDEDLTLEMILDEITFETKMEFINRTIGTILNDAELIETVKVLFKQNHSLKNTANHLHIHINTLHYRLKRLKEMTKLDSGNINDLLKLYIAILFLDETLKI
jgi:carbohydrate diacid regulator